jgi:hypothetical protein
MTTLEEIETVFEILLQYCRLRGMTGIDDARFDMYWTIASAEWLRIEAEPAPAVGSFVDDFSELSKLRDEPSRANAVDLERLAHVLMLLSEGLVCQSQPSTEPTKEQSR